MATFRVIKENCGKYVLHSLEETFGYPLENGFILNDADIAGELTVALNVVNEILDSSMAIAEPSFWYTILKVRDRLIVISQTTKKKSTKGLGKFFSIESAESVIEKIGEGRILSTFDFLENLQIEF